MADHDYCKIYVDSDRSFNNLKSTISEFLGSPVEGRTIEGRFMAVDCFENNASGEGNGFLYWPYYLEIEISESANAKDFVIEIQSLINGLKLEEMKLTPSCDFEDELIA